MCRLALLVAIVAFIPNMVCAAVAPTLDVTKDEITVRNGEQRLALRLSDGVIQLQTPYGSHDLTISITNPGGWAHPGQVIVPPKTYRSRDLVTAIVTFAVPGDRKLNVRLSAYAGVPAIFVTSGVTGLFGSSRDYYFWSWNQPADSVSIPGRNGPEARKTDAKMSRFGHNDWVFLPEGTGGLAVITNGSVGYMAGEPGQPFLNALPRWRFLLPGETLDIGVGFAGVKDTAEASALFRTAAAKKLAELKPYYITKQAKIDYGRPAPDWLRNADIYNGWYREWSDDMIDGWMKGFPLVVGVPAKKDVIEKAHQAGLRVIVYVNYMELQNSEVQLKAKGHLYRWPDEATPADLLDLAKHPNWTCIDSDGSDRRSSWGILQDIPGVFSTCFHQADLRQNALTQVLNIMNLGADGVFVDNAAAVHECYGPKFGKHTHDDPYPTNTAASEELEKEIYKLVKSFGDDKIVMHNSGILPSHWAYCDAQMWEGFRFDDQHSEPITDWSELQYAAEEHADAVRHGKVPVVLSYFSKLPPDKRVDGALYTYAYTRLYGFLLADWFDLSKSPENQKLAKAIYGIRLGKPLGSVQNAGGVLYRVFEKGAAVLNPTRGPIHAVIPVNKHGQLLDVAHDRAFTVSDKTLELEMTPESGRVLVWVD